VTGRYPRRAVRLARLYGLTPAQLGALPLEVYDLLCSLPEPGPRKRIHRDCLRDWFTRPSASLADLCVIGALVLSVHVLNIDLHLPWWAAFLVVFAVWAVGMSAAGFARSRLSLRRRA
jgi:hypothetical protein